MKRPTPTQVAIDVCKAALAVPVLAAAICIYHLAYVYERRMERRKR